MKKKIILLGVILVCLFATHNNVFADVDYVTVSNIDVEAFSSVSLASTSTTTSSTTSTITGGGGGGGGGGFPYPGEIIRITNNNYEDCSIITVNSQGHIWWISGNGLRTIMFYNGTETIQIRPYSSSFLQNSSKPVTQGNCIVYAEADGSELGDDHEIYLFDGQNEIQITDNDYKDMNPVICNGYIAWVGYPDGEGTDCEIFLYKPYPTTTVPPTTTTIVPSTMIEISALEAIPSDEEVKLKWQTESEIDNAGFNVWRAEGFKKINEWIIPAEGDPTMGSEYDFVDNWVLNGKRYFYLLEDVDLNGISRFHGPVKAVPSKIYGIFE